MIRYFIGFIRIIPSLRGTHFPWATRKLTAWPPDSSWPGNVTYLLVSTHLIASPFELLLPLLSSLWASLSFHLQPPTHWPDTAYMPESIWGFKESFQEETVSELNVPVSDSLTTQ